MTTLALTLVSVLGLAALTWLAGRAFRWPLCPICFGVGGTWLWMLVARQAGFAVDATMLAVLLAASVVAVTERLEGRLRQGPSRLLWKVLVLTAGLLLAYGVAAASWRIATVAGLAFLLPAAWALLPRRLPATHAAAVEKLEQEMTKCC